MENRKNRMQRDFWGTKKINIHKLGRLKAKIRRACINCNRMDLKPFMPVAVRVFFVVLIAVLVAGAYCAFRYEGDIDAGWCLVRGQLILMALAGAWAKRRLFGE